MKYVGKTVEEAIFMRTDMGAGGKKETVAERERQRKAIAKIKNGKAAGIDGVTQRKW